MQLRNPIYTADGRIDCEIDHPIYGWVPFTASDHDLDVINRAVFAAAADAKPAPYVAPPPLDPAVVLESTRATMRLTRRQVFIGMADAGLITAPEAIAVATVGTVPAAINAAIQSLPAAQRTPALITFGLFQTAYRTDPMVSLFQSTAGMDDAAMDAFFTTYAGV